MPEPTAYDVRFHFLGIPVRVHPMFWLVSGLLGSQGGKLSTIAIWVACVFVSIMVHEFGHGLMARLLGYPASIVLYGMGGLCYSESERQGPWQRLAVLICGPGAGFLLAGLLIAGYWAAGFPRLSYTGDLALRFMIYINTRWGLLNLLPIWPLDGGQMTGVILTMFNRRKGMSRAHTVALVTAGLIALYSLVKLQDLFYTVFFGFFALTNYQILQSQYERSKYGLDDNADWWQR